jgi:hypothetical protein
MRRKREKYIYIYNRERATTIKKIKLSVF